MSLESMGAEAVCPPSARVGHGRADGVAGGTPVGFDLAVYTVDRRLAFAAERDGMPLKAGFFGVAHGRRLVLTVPTSDGAIAPTLFRAAIERTGGWLRTPATCPSSGRWTARARFRGLSAVDGTPVGAGRTLAEPLACRR